MLPDLKDYQIDRYELPNILSLNFYVHDILQEGVSSSTRLDGQAKSLGEYLRAKDIEVPDFLINWKRTMNQTLSLEGLVFLSDQN